MRSLRICNLVLLALVLALPAAAERKLKPPPAKVMIVLDASGSMRGKVGGKVKMAIARAVIRDLVKGLDPNLQLGLSAYGHRRKGDCKDIQTLIPIGKVDPRAIVRAVDALKPKGKTPLSAAVRLAAEQLQYEEDPATVILVTDGKETCNADPCALGKALEEAGLDFTAHVIGFDVKKKDQAGLRCLAENTGGQFYAADGAEELGKALRGSLKKAAMVKPGVRFVAVLTEGGKPIESGLSWRIFRAGAGDKPEGKSISYSASARPRFTLPAGRFVVQAQYGVGRATLAFEVKPDEEVEHTLVLGTGTAIFQALVVEGGKPIADGVRWWVYRAGAGDKPAGKSVSYSPSARPRFNLPAGRYVVQASYGKGRASLAFEVKAGEETEHTLILGTGTAIFQALVVEGGKPIARGVRWWVYRAGAGDKQEGKSVIYSPSARPRFTLPAGRYVIQASYGKGRASLAFEVKADQETEHTLILGTGTVVFRALAAGGGKPIAGGLRWWVYRAGADGKQEGKSIIYSPSKAPRFILPAGHYVVQVTHGKLRGTLAFEIKAGEEAARSVRVGAQ